MGTFGCSRKNRRALVRCFELRVRADEANSRVVREEEVDGKRLIVIEVKAGTRDRPACAVHQRKIWDCTVVELKTDWSEDFFATPIPPDKKIFDFDTGKVAGALPEKPTLQIGQWLSGETHRMDDFRGLWCSPCRASVPQLKKFQDQFKDHPVVFISIHSADQNLDELSAKIKKFAAENEWEYLAAIDSGSMIENSVTTIDYGVKGFPMRVIIGPDGKIIYVDDQEGMDCDESDPKVRNAFQKRFRKIWKARFEAVGEKYVPLNMTKAPGEQTQKLYERVEHQYLVKLIETAISGIR